MLNDKIKQFISINVTGHVFMFCTREGIKDPKQIRQYEKRAREYLEQIANEGTDIKGLEKELRAFLERLRDELHQEIEIVVDEQPPLEPEPVTYSDAMFAEEEAKLKEEEARKKAEKEEREKARQEREKNGKKSAPKQQSARMEEKLAIQRKPIQELLTKECVEFKLMTPERAKHWVFNLSGRRIEDVENDIVDELRQKLQDNVKSYMRKNKKENPWPSPALQEELRMEISLVKTIKGMLMLTSNILWEIRNAKESGKVSFFNRIKKKIGG